MNILISGLTGAGKTTISQSLSSCIGYKWISGSSLRAKEIGSETCSREFWLFDQTALAADKERLKDRKIESVDNMLLTLFSNATKTVFDVWYLPWLIEKTTITWSVWLEAPIEVRAKRVQSENTSKNLDKLDERIFGSSLFSVEKHGGLCPPNPLRFIALIPIPMW